MWPRMGSRGSRSGSYKDVRYKKQSNCFARSSATPNKEERRDTIEGRKRNSCETESHAGQEGKVPKGALQRAVTISAFQRPPQVSMT